MVRSIYEQIIDISKDPLDLDLVHACEHEVPQVSREHPLNFGLHPVPAWSNVLLFASQICFNGDVWTTATKVY